MAEEKDHDIIETVDDVGDEALCPSLVAAMKYISRHAFVPHDQTPGDQEKRPLPIGHGKTISQWRIVTQLPRLMRAQGVGTGSGCQVAILFERMDTGPPWRLAAGRTCCQS